MIKRIVICVLFLLSVGLPCAIAQNVYVSGITKITMRTGPGVEHKIVAMLVSGDGLDILEYQKDWSRVQTRDGKSGWVLTRFLTEEEPLALQVQKLSDENQRLSKSLKEIEEKNRVLAQKNESLEKIKEKYHSLETASADFLKLDAEYKDLLALSREQARQIDKLSENLNNEENLWFLSGGGVFIVGMILGLSTRKKKRRSLL